MRAGQALRAKRYPLGLLVVRETLETRTPDPSP